MSPEHAQWLKDTVNIRQPSVIVCSARRNLKGEVICAPRHFDMLMHEQVDRAKNPEDWKDRKGIEQGFVDQFCQFLTRTEAWPIAEAAGQIVRRVGGDNADGGTLYSENLY